DFIALTEQRVHTILVTTGRKQVADDKTEAGATGSTGVILQGNIEIDKAAGLERTDIMEHGEAEATPAHRAKSLLALAVERGNREAVIGRQSDIAEASDQPLRITKFVLVRVALRPIHAG